MRVVISLTWNASEMRRTSDLWSEYGDHRNPFEHILVSPLFADPSVLRTIRELQEQWGSKIYFDSGGYYVQQGRMAYPVLCERLRDYYRDPANQWADYYVLPDHVPTSTDSEKDVERKVAETCTVARQFFHDMPSTIKERALPVIQGHMPRHILTCIETFSQLGIQHVGFGSFGTSGATNSINTLTRNAFHMLTHVRDLAAHHHLRVHLFGVGTPPILYLFHRMGFASFDSMAWARAGGYGNAFLPFMQGFMVSQTAAAMFRSSLDSAAFERFKVITSHQCAFCHDFVALTSNRFNRILHNLTCVLDTVDFIQTWSTQRILEAIEAVSPRYLRYYREWATL